MAELRQQPPPKGGTGRTTIDNPERQNRSIRAAKGNLDVVRKDCPKCYHHKALVTANITKCSRCKYVHSVSKTWYKT